MSIGIKSETSKTKGREMTETMVECTQCGSQNSFLAIFPGGLCLTCYGKKIDSEPEPTDGEIVAMWRGPGLLS